MLEYFNDMAIFRNICNQKTLLDGVVFIGSFALTIWFTSIQFDRYGRNQDQSLISYHDIIFDSKSKDQPPTYTLCIDNDNLIDEYISNSNNVFKQHSPAWMPNVTSPEVYYEYLSGGLPTDSAALGSDVCPSRMPGPPPQQRPIPAPPRIDQHLHPLQSPTISHGSRQSGQT